MYMYTSITYVFVCVCMGINVCIHCYVYNIRKYIHKLKRTKNIGTEHVITCLISVIGHMAVAGLYSFTHSVPLATPELIVIFTWWADIDLHC